MRDANRMSNEILTYTTFKNAYQNDFMSISENGLLVLSAAENLVQVTALTQCVREEVTDRGHQPDPVGDGRAL